MAWPSTAPTSGSPTYFGNSVTELTASSGSWVRTLSGGSYAFSEPVGCGLRRHPHLGHQLGGNSVTELTASTGSWVQTLSGGSYGFNDPVWCGLRRHPHLGRQRKAETRSPSSPPRTGAGCRPSPAAPTGSTTRTVWPSTAPTSGSTTTAETRSPSSPRRTGAGCRRSPAARTGSAGPRGVAFDGAHIWVTNYERKLRHRGAGGLTRPHPRWLAVRGGGEGRLLAMTPTFMVEGEPAADEDYEESRPTCHCPEISSVCAGGGKGRPYTATSDRVGVGAALAAARFRIPAARPPLHTALYNRRGISMSLSTTTGSRRSRQEAA